MFLGEVSRLTSFELTPHRREAGSGSERAIRVARAWTLAEPRSPYAPRLPSHIVVAATLVKSLL
jgi:hypothetical protein